MPISQLRALDIRTKEEELLVQEVLNEKLQYEPKVDLNKVTFSSQETDRLTPEIERELQAKIDGSVTHETIVIDDEIEVAVPTTEVVESNKFCDFCDSKGVRHKKNCTRLLTNEKKDV